jgi:hypothetical protein
MWNRIESTKWCQISSNLKSTKGSNKREGVKEIVSSSLFQIGELSVSDTFILTDCIVLHHWWIALSSGQSHIFHWIYILEQRSVIFIELALATCYIWFTTRAKKPPDKDPNERVNTISFRDYPTFSIYVIEDIMYFIFGVNIDLCYWTYIISSVVMDYIFDFINIFLKVQYKQTCLSDNIANTKKWSSPNCQKDIELFEINKKDPLRFKNGKVIQSNLVFSMSAKSSTGNGFDDIMNADTDSYTAAIDTCTSESICKHKELFVGDIKECKNVYVQGVGGKIKASGYGSVKMRILDDEGKLFDLVIHNVIYLPDSPINLISPQRWSEGTKHPTGTGELTIGGTTLLFWNQRKSTKIIPHHPELGIPIMSFNDGYTKSAAFLSTTATNTMFCLPCTVLLQSC